jgi:hypothetical protein
MFLFKQAGCSASGHGSTVLLFGLFLFLYNAFDDFFVIDNGLESADCSARWEREYIFYIAIYTRFGVIVLDDDGEGVHVHNVVTTMRLDQRVLVA